VFELNEKFWWYLSRSSGIVAWFILAAAVLWGLFLSTRILQTKRKPAWLLDLHRWLGGLAVVFTGFHLLGLAMDSYVHFGLKEFLVPMASEWQPAAVAWGVIALYLLVAVQTTSVMMKRMPRRVWKGIHYSSLVLFWTAAIHGALAGTDSSAVWYQVGSVVMIAATIIVVIYRVLTARALQKTPLTPDRDPVGAS
jgi:predicted ferric reductase